MTAALTLGLVVAMAWRIEVASSGTGPQSWLLIDDGSLTFGAGELAGGPGRAGVLVDFQFPDLDLDTAPFFRMRDGWFLGRLPLWIPLLLSAVPTVWLWMRVRQTARGLCRTCGYDLRGLNEAISRCPECGTAREGFARHADEPGIIP